MPKITNKNPWGVEKCHKGILKGTDDNEDDYVGHPIWYRFVAFEDLLPKGLNEWYLDLHLLSLRLTMVHGVIARSPIIGMRLVPLYLLLIPHLLF